jgi:hypothetical protein
MASAMVSRSAIPVILVVIRSSSLKVVFADQLLTGSGAAAVAGASVPACEVGGFRRAR